MKQRTPAVRLAAAGEQLSDSLQLLRARIPADAVYDPTVYASEPHRNYLGLCAAGPRRVLMLGMNPGPWGMAQTGVPFGAVSMVSGWMGISGRIGHPDEEHPQRKVAGWQCTRDEVSGMRLWGLIRQLYGSAQDAFAELAVLNYCPLLLLEANGRGVRNLPPERLPAGATRRLQELCDEHLAYALELLAPEIAVGIGAYAHACLLRTAPKARCERMLHPSPASPQANRGFAAAARAQLSCLGITGVAPQAQSIVP